MSVMAGIIAGLIIGWIIEWIIDWRFWRSLAASADLDTKLAASEAKLADADGQVSHLQDELKQLSTQNKASVAGSNGENAAEELQKQLDAAQAKIAELESAGQEDFWSWL